jgi:threonine/homoserine/homoserine lactone efflux protein
MGVGGAVSGAVGGAVSVVNWDTYWLYVLTEAALSLSPGPAVMLVIAYGLTQGARRSVPATLGILSANAFYFTLSATSLGAVIAASPGFFTVVKWIGAAYLVYLGLSAIFGKPSPLTVSDPGSRNSSRWSIFLAGLTLQLANPKTLIFFVAILPQFVDPRLPVGAQMIWLAAGSVIPEFFILLGYGFLASRARAIATDLRFARWTERVAGVLVLIVAALVVTVTPDGVVPP